MGLNFQDIYFNLSSNPGPLLLTGPLGATLCTNFDFKIRRNQGKLSYERHVYESGDDSSLSKVIHLKNRRKTECDQQRVNKKYHCT